MRSRIATLAILHLMWGDASPAERIDLIDEIEDVSLEDLLERRPLRRKVELTLGEPRLLWIGVLP